MEYAVNIILLVDSSRNMSSGKIESINDWIPNFIWSLSAINNNPNFLTRVSLMEISNDAKWSIKGQRLETCRYQAIQPRGNFNLAYALKNLNDNLYPNDGLLSYGLYNNSTIIILIAGSNSIGDWHKELNSLTNNNYFNSATRLAFAIGDKADIGTLKNFTGSMESVLKVSQLDLMHQLLKHCYIIDEIEAPVNDSNNFSDILKSIYEEQGPQFLISSNLFNILNDYQAFRNDKSIKYILKNISEIDLKNLWIERDWKINCYQIYNKLKEDYGFDPNKVSYVLLSLLYASGHYPHYPG